MSAESRRVVALRLRAAAAREFLWAFGPLKAMKARLLTRAARLGMRTASRAATVRERLRSELSTEPMEIRLLTRAARLGMRTASRAATVRERTPLGGYIMGANA